MRSFHDIRSNNEVKTPCPHCGKVYWSDEPRNLRRHITKYHGLKGKNLPEIEGRTCPVCFKTFFSKTNVRRHLLTEHENVLRMKCPHCEKSFASVSSLNYHVKEHSPNTEIKCEKCDETLQNLQAYRIHQKTHIKSKEFKCSECEKVLSSSKSLSRHLQEKHFQTKFDTDKITVKSYAHGCDQCDYKSKRKEHLQSHVINKHNEVKKMIPCEICGKVFTNKQNMNRHVKKLH